RIRRKTLGVEPVLTRLHSSLVRVAELHRPSASNKLRNEADTCRIISRGCRREREPRLIRRDSLDLPSAEYRSGESASLVKERQFVEPIGRQNMPAVQCRTSHLALDIK